MSHHIAQLRWDVAAEVGAMQRFTTGASAGAKPPDVGPAVELEGHLALVPMVRAGAYLAEDTSYASGAGARTFWAGGFHFKVTPPMLAAPWRAWVFAGVGYVYTYTPTYPGWNGASVESGGASGGIIEVPFGLGLGRRLVAPWVVFVELGGRIGTWFFGPMYERVRGTAPGAMGSGSEGRDSFALSLSLGLSLEK